MSGARQNQQSKELCDRIPDIAGRVVATESVKVLSMLV